MHILLLCSFIGGRWWWWSTVTKKRNKNSEWLIWMKRTVCMCFRNLFHMAPHHVRLKTKVKETRNFNIFIINLPSPFKVISFFCFVYIRRIVSLPFPFDETAKSMLQGSGWPLALYYYNQFGINVGSSSRQQLLLKAKVKWPTFWVFCINFLVPPSPNFCCSDWLSRLFGLIFAATCCCLRLLFICCFDGQRKGINFWLYCAGLATHICSPYLFIILSIQLFKVKGYNKSKKVNR